MSLTRTALVSALAVTAAGVVAVGAPGVAGADRITDQERQRTADLQTAKQLSARYHDVRKAIADGFAPTDVCEAIATGGMGYHYANLDNFGSTDLSRPAVLLYEPDGKGGVRLAGVEWVVPDADQDLATDGDRPSMFAGQEFDGPMLGHFPGMPTHYDLHVWLWEKNPDGVFAQWNPAVTCD